MNLVKLIFIGAMSVNALTIKTVSNIEETSQVTPEYEEKIKSIKENINSLLKDINMVKTEAEVEEEEEAEEEVVPTEALISFASAE